MIARRNNFIVLSLLICAFGIAPPLAGAFLNASSSALGLTIVAVFSSLLLKSYSLFKFGFKRKSVYILFLFIGYFIFQQFINGIFELKSYASVLLAIFLLHLAKIIGRRLSALNLRGSVERILRLTSIIFIAIFAFNYTLGFEFAKDLYQANRSVFPFGEPSHFALFVGPFLVLWGTLANSKLRQVSLLLCMTWITFGLQSLTFGVYVILYAILVFYNRNSLISLFSVGFFVIMVAVAAASNSYYSDRLTISSDTENISTLVYIQGVQDAWNSIISSYGFGLGFQMLGTQPPSAASLLIADILDTQPEFSLNRFDGGFLAAKIISEFGVPGLLLVIICAIKIIHSIGIVINRNSSGINDLQISFNTFFACSAVEFFVRGMGYFSPSLFILLIMYFASKYEHLSH